MSITNQASGTNIQQVALDTYRINTPIELPDGGGFCFNQYLIVDDEPLLFHSGLRQLFPLVREAIATVLPPERLRWIGVSHVEADECGSLNDWLAIAEQARPLCSVVGALVSIGDLADREPRGMADAEELTLGQHRLRWLDAPHLPHGWDCGYLMDCTSETLLCGDLFTQPGKGDDALIQTDILGPSESFRGSMDYFAHSSGTADLIEKLAASGPRQLACMHGSAWQGDGAGLLRQLGQELQA
ncbi:MAG: MBL fold metallo-hydrolase [Synechococcus sp. TMED155]|nr:MAG: MBL fold metallo-hydrolase [Synechococcus sp. TMED155]